MGRKISAINKKLYFSGVNKPIENPFLKQIYGLRNPTYLSFCSRNASLIFFTTHAAVACRNPLLNLERSNQQDCLYIADL